ncbi:bifunctional UDP-N-acetylglucosamine diphosphorylase/glucosamine-1-phosphate N-acetyltransferase GlmU [Amnimonas aquatica]|uniref:Bifunctional protein GlmU n=1 Tax=Amnimonas aquatica TaxID=2094561 RepID=A0A2P6AUW3_9GAMM|nr:bifunctional UDP-N-acetylglucosamine diphosphorylase/glucosamine-1-phosphate N-acetyltransferase GlmU [Amnimonas aquatica]PQA51108.1 bifunctional N-acetylglucosamine-1-phosphate uridyltransferase/glucosamine-1-phosphate acetyltransferase [Amnimonas aquatica]
MALQVVILAAGKGTRMRSSLPKVMQPLAGRPLLAHVLAAARALGAERPVVVYGHGGDVVQQAFAGEAIDWVLQAEQKGTGHAVQVALPVLAGEGRTLILYGDVPLISVATLQRLIEAVPGDDSLGLLTVHLPDPTGYGRIVREGGRVTRIVEQKDASEAERAISEVNTGILCVPNRLLHDWLPTLKNENAQGEYYLTDLIGMASAAGAAVNAVHPATTWEVEGVNDKLQLATLERVWQRHQAEGLMRAGVTVLDPARLDIRGSLAHGQDVSLDAGVIIEGRVVLGDNVRVGAGCILKDCEIGAGTEIRPYSLIDTAVVGANAQIGPFARLRPGSRLGDEVHIGNFVETKATSMGTGAKANHLAYLGDSEIGSGVNIGAGSITCNYDGASKHRTVIGDDAFIGTNNSLVAPVRIGAGATTGAGSTISKDVPDGVLAVARAVQKNIEGWQRPRKTPKA